MRTCRLTERKETTSPEATIALGEAVGRALTGGLTLGLVGPLGAGKTQLVKGIAAANAAGETVTVASPTFTLVHEYPGRLHLYHVDTYRLGGSADLWALGMEDWTRPDTALIVEWADRVREVIPHEALWIEIAVIGELERRYTFDARGEGAVECVKRLSADDH